MATSDTYNFNPAIADLVVEAYSRIGMRGPQLSVEHVVEARRSLNLVLSDISSNRGGPDLWSVGLLNVACVGGVGQYTLPSNFIQILDAYVRQYQMGTTATLIGTTQTAIVDQTGAPVISQDGQPLVQQATSGAFTTTAGSQTISVYSPAHGLSVGSAILLETPVTAGPMTLNGLIVVQSVIDSNNFTFLAPTAATFSGTGLGGTPLYYTQSGSATVTVYLDNHGFSVGSTYTPGVAITVGGLTLSQTTYTVASVPNYYSFSITSTTGNATSTTTQFLNSGQIGFYSQQSGVDPIDIILSPLSRTDFASIPDKYIQGRPTSFWLDRIDPPTLNIWLVPQAGQYYAVGIYHMRQIQDANPTSGQTIDLPQRMLHPITCLLTAALAEKYAPALFQGKAAYAEMVWNRAAIEDRELTPIQITPITSSYWR